MYIGIFEHFFQLLIHNSLLINIELNKLNKKRKERKKRRVEDTFGG